MRLSFKYLMLYLACYAAKKVENVSYGINVMPYMRVYFIPTLIDCVVLAAAVKLGQNAYHVRAWDTLSAVGIVPSNDEHVTVKANDAVHGILVGTIIINPSKIKIR